MDFINDDNDNDYFVNDEQDFNDGFEQDEGPEMGETFKETQHKQTFGETLDARSQKDKPFIALKEAYIQLDKESAFIDKEINKVRTSEVFPFINAIYYANARLFLKNYESYSSKNIETWVNNQNNRFGEKYLNIIDFFRYIRIVEKINFSSE